MAATNDTPPLSKAQWKSISNVNWKRHAETVRLFMQDEKRTYTPKMINQYGQKNFRLDGDTLFLFGREIVIDEKRREKILDEEEGKFGGVAKAHERILRKYINIGKRALTKFYRGSERRQLKAQYIRPKKTSTFIHATHPGALQIDLTFYRGQQIPVFGAVDVFSRWAYYEVLDKKKGSVVVESIKRCIQAFEKVSKHRVHQLASDAGTEFINKTTRAYLKKSHIHYDQQARSRKLIESLNRTLRRFIERVGWDTKDDLRKLTDEFVETYNNSKHSSTKKIPNDLVRIEEKKALKDESKRQFKTKHDRVTSGNRFNMATLKVSDLVRIYDPKRREIKAKQKAQLKGKKKLSEDDYVKKYTSSHRGQEAHWTKTVYKIEKIIKGTRGAARYKVTGRKAVFLRSELQKVTPVTKKDPRAHIHDAKERAKKEKRERLEREEEIRKAKLEKEKATKALAGKMIIAFNTWSDKKTPIKDDPALVLTVFRGYLIVYFTKSKDIDWLNPDDVHSKLPRKVETSVARGYIYDNKKQIGAVRGQILKHIEEEKKKEKEAQS